jgi:hypothetical protein
MRRVIGHLVYFNVITSKVEFVIQVIEEIDFPFLIRQIDIVVDIIALVYQLPDVPFSRRLAI